jgi:hypothetical protein
MTTPDTTGKRFSQAYLTGGEALSDSKRARLRVARLLGVLFDRESTDHAFALNKFMERVLGVHIERAGSGSQYNAENFIERCELRDFLDLISVVLRFLASKDRIPQANRWLDECQRIFAEEKLRYTIDHAGGVRFSADAQFEEVVQATIQHLDQVQLRGALDSFNKSLKAMSEVPPDGKVAIVDAVEIVFKTLCAGPPRVGSTEITTHLLPKLDAEYANDPIAKEAAKKLARSMGEWVNGAHFYRHGQPGPEPVQPPLELATAFVSEGISFLRWLAGLHARLNN